MGRWENAKPIGQTRWEGATPEKETRWDKAKSVSVKTEPAPTSRFMKAMDIIGRPSQAYKGAVLERIRQKPQIDIGRVTQFGVDPMMMASQAAFDFLGNVKSQENQMAILDATKAGFTGQQQVTGNEIWREVGVEKVPGLGFATELALDPLMYGGYGAITRGVGKGLKLVGKGAMKIPAFARTAQATAQKIQPVTSWVREKFVTKTGLDKLGDLIEKHLLNRQYLKAKEIKYGTKIRNVVQNISKKYGQSIDDIEKQVISLIEQPQITPPNVIPEARTLANTLRSHLTGMLTAELKAGVPITSLSQGSRAIQYFPRITSKEAVNYLQEARKSYRGIDSKVWNTMIANAKKRKTIDFTLQEFNDFVAAHGLKSLGGRSLEQFFLKKPALAVTLRGARSAKAITSAQFLDDVGKMYGTKTAPSWYVDLPEGVTKLHKSLKGLKFDPDVAAEITRTYGNYINPQQIGQFRKGFDTVQNMWKAWTLAPFPKYHLRNMVGNLWNNFLADVSFSAYPKAQAVQLYRKFKGTGGYMEKIAWSNLRKAGISLQQADDVIINAEKFQVLGRGWFGADIETSIERQIKSKFSALPLKKKLKKVFVPGRENIVVEKGMEFGTTVENNARLAHFIDRLGKGDDALSASRSVKKFLFDYGDLTAFEKSTMKRLFPFYTWTRKNVPLQLEMLWKQPEKFMGLSPLIRNRNPQELLQMKYARPDLYDRLPVELRRDADTVTYVPLEGLIPAGDLAKLGGPRQMQEAVIELLSPYLRAPLELRFNKSLYFESEIQKYDKETQPLLRMDIPVRTKYLLTTILPQARLVNEMNKLVKKNIRKEKLTFAEQVFSQSLSSIYKIPLVELRQRALWQLDKKVQELESGFRRTRFYERPEEAARIKKAYLEILKEVDKVKGR